MNTAIELIDKYIEDLKNNDFCHIAGTYDQVVAQIEILEELKDDLEA